MNNLSFADKITQIGQELIECGPVFLGEIRLVFLGDLMIVVNVFLTASGQSNAVLDVLSPLFHVVITVSLSDVYPDHLKKNKPNFT